MTWLGHWTGADGGVVYNVVSGPLPLVAYGGVIFAAYHHLREKNCHEHGCLRMGRVPHPDGVHRVCKKHWHKESVSPTGLPR